MVLVRGLNPLDDNRTGLDASPGDSSWCTATTLSIRGSTGGAGTSEEIDASFEQFRSRVDDVDQLSDQVHQRILMGLIAAVMIADGC